MAKLTKKQKEAASKIEKNKLYSLKDAAALLKVVASAKFDESVDIAVRLGVDPRKANQMVRGVVTLPHGTGKDVKVLALVTPDKEAEAREAGADHVGLDVFGAEVGKPRDCTAFNTLAVRAVAACAGCSQAGRLKRFFRACVFGHSPGCQQKTAASKRRTDQQSCGALLKFTHGCLSWFLYESMLVQRLCRRI